MTHIQRKSERETERERERDYYSILETIQLRARYLSLIGMLYI